MPAMILAGLFGFTVMLIISGDDQHSRVRVNHMFHSTPKSTPAASQFRSTRPASLFVAIPSATRSPSPRPGTHFGRGHMNSSKMAPQFETPSSDSGHFGRGHLHTQAGMHFGRGHMK
jgi:hypothetical protein